MMRGFIVVVLVLFLSINVNAQSRVEGKAKFVTELMTEVLGLTAKESHEMYLLQVERITVINSGGNKEALKPYFNKIAKLLGAKRKQKWANYLESEN